MQVSTSTVLQGEKNLNLVKSGWYFDHNRESSGDWENGRLYWVIDVTGTEISAGTQIKDVPTGDASLHQVRGTSMTGLYIGTIPDGKSFTDYYGSVRELEADKKMKKLSGNDKNGEALPADADYAWSAPADGTSATIEISTWFCRPDRPMIWTGQESGEIIIMSCGSGRAALQNL